MSDSEVEQASVAPQAPVSGKRKCSPEQLERLARAREKALEKRAALAALRQKEKELADLALQERFRKAEQLDREFKERGGRGSYGAGSKPSGPQTPTPKVSKKAAPQKKVREPPPPPSCSSSEAEESEESEEEAPPPPPKSHRRSAVAATRTRMRTDPQDEWMQLARRVFPGL